MLPYLEPEKLFFSTFDETTLKEIAVKRITNPTSIDRLGNAFPGKFTPSFTYCSRLDLNFQDNDKLDYNLTQ